MCFMCEKYEGVNIFMTPEIDSQNLGRTPKYLEVLTKVPICSAQLSIEPICRFLSVVFTFKVEC